ncbi:MAG TPA: NAD(P)-binding domain-containing protein [Vicinamibacterales bacterium]|nr:NAD(P)-binding domain-containing protein [Vicinamibacterales bacterium]
MARIALIGTGMLGSGMVRHFLKSGTEVTVWNRTEEKARALAAEGAAVAASPAAAVSGASRVHFVLPDDAIVDGILDRIAPALKDGVVVVDHSTTLPEGTAKRAERLRARGIRFLHAPVFMSPQMAADGAGLMLASGPQREFDEVRAALEGMTGEVWYLGARPDLAAAYKLFGNCMLFAISGGLADVVTMARANGIDPVDAMSVFTKFQAGNIIHGRGPRMARGEVTPASFAVAMARKDVALMIAAAKDQPLVAMPCVAKRMDEVIAAGGAGMDIAALGPARATAK